MSINATCAGNGISRIVRKGGKIDRLEIIDASQFKRVDILKSGVPIYVFENNSKEYHIAGRDLIHIPNYAGNGIVGSGWLDSARSAVSGGLSQQSYGNSVHENSGNVSGMLTIEKRLDAPAKQRIAQDWNRKYSGANNAGKTAILDENMKYTKLPLTLEESQLIESKYFTVEEISRVSRIPQHMLSNLQNATFSNIEQQSLEFVTYAILPWVKKWEMELNRKLLKEDEKGTHFIKFNLDALQRADIDSRGKFYASGVNTGWLTRNEVRRLENLNSIEGLDEPLQPLNFTSVNDADKPDDPYTDKPK